MHNDYVLGGGHTGLITGYLTGFTVITPNIKGPMGSSFPLGPRILHNDEFGSYLIDNLGIKAAPKVYRIAYFYKGMLSNYLTPDMQQQYFRKTRGEGTPFASAMSGGKKLISGWDMDEIKLLDALQEKCNIIIDDVDGIDIVNNKIHAGHRILQYDKLINTLNIKTFAQLAKLPLTSELHALPTTFILINCNDNIFKGYDYVYIVDEDIPFHRMTNLKDGRAVLEIKGAYNYNSLTKLAEQHDILKCKVVDGCQIINSQKITSFGDIPMIGRYAQWCHGIKANNVVKEVLELCSKDYAV